MNLLLALVVAATPAVMMHAEPEVKGWSKDGRFFVWTWQDSSYIEGEDVDDVELAETARVAVVYDSGSRKQTEYLLSYKAVRAKNDGELKKRYAGKPTKADLDLWRREHPLVTTTGSFGPRGEAASVVVDETPQSQWSCSEGCTVTLSVKKGAEENSVDFNDGPIMFLPEHTVDVYWDPTGYQAAFVVWTAAAQTMRGLSPASAELYLLTIPSTRVQIVSASRLEEKANALGAKLTELNYKVEVAAAQKDRNATVIYAAAGAEDDAKALAKLIKGATIAPLTWKPGAEIVIALGAPGAR